MINSSTCSQLPRFHASEVAFGALKGNGSFCNIFEVKSLQSIKCETPPSEQNTTKNKTNSNDSWDAVLPLPPKSNNLPQSISHERTKIFNTNNKATTKVSSSLQSQLSNSLSDSTNKLRSLILNTSSYHNRVQSRKQILVAKLPKKNQNIVAYKENVKNLKLEAKILASMNHDNIIRIHGMSDDKDNSEDQIDCSAEGHLPFFIILDCLSCTLDQKIENWTRANIQRKRNNTSVDIRGIKRNDSACSTTSAPLESVYKIFLLNKSSKPSPLITNNTGSDLTRERLDILLDISSAMRYIHKRNIIHRDLKPENIGFDSNGTVKIFDFGLSVELDSLTPLEHGGYKIQGGIGTCRYMAPEVAEHRPYNLQSDVYSFAMLMYNLLGLVRPYEGLHRKEWFHLAILGARRPSMEVIKDECVSLEIKTLMRQCWDSKWTKRPTFDDIESVLREDSCTWYD